MDVKIICITEEQLTSLQTSLARLEENQSRFFDISVDSTLYTSEEVQKLLGISQKTLQTYRDKGHIEFIQVGTLVRYSKNSITDFMKRFTYKINL